jgi:hypothetical protein
MPANDLRRFKSLGQGMRNIPICMAGTDLAFRQLMKTMKHANGPHSLPELQGLRTAFPKAISDDP